MLPWTSSTSSGSKIAMPLHESEVNPNLVGLDMLRSVSSPQRTRQVVGQLGVLEEHCTAANTPTRLGQPPRLPGFVTCSLPAGALSSQGMQCLSAREISRPGTVTPMRPREVEAKAGRQSPSPSPTHQWLAGGQVAASLSVAASPVWNRTCHAVDSGPAFQPSWSSDCLAQSQGLHLPVASPTAGLRTLPATCSSQEAALTECRCCKPRTVPTPETHHRNRVLELSAPIEKVAEAENEDLPSALEAVFGQDGLHAIFGQSRLPGARRLKCSGHNHVFMVEFRGKLAKCTKPHGGAGGHFSEVLEAARLRNSAPGLPEDPHAVFPESSFLCEPKMSRNAVDSLSAGTCEVLVFDFIEGCQSVGDLFHVFERTHQCGVLKAGTSCQEHRQGLEGRCSHALALRSLMRQAARMGRRFQAMHGRRHGDFKADNVLIDRRGRLLLSDFLSPFCTSCDAEEFRNSLHSSHPVSQELQAAFQDEWQASQSNVSFAEDNADLRQNSWLREELQQLLEASRQQPLFGPMPDLLQGIAGWTPSPSLGSLPTNSPGASVLTDASSDGGFGLLGSAGRVPPAWFEMLPGSAKSPQANAMASLSPASDQSLLAKAAAIQSTANRIGAAYSPKAFGSNTHNLMSPASMTRSGFGRSSPSRGYEGAFSPAQVAVFGSPTGSPTVPPMPSPFFPSPF
mmetsp:Transcript_63740/g.113402  ORF Transcript_63740/g.113402 Transcript_63740/m.113402 type:complete len:681 (+) Transcript_63740:53-2095(+)